MSLRSHTSLRLKRCLTLLLGLCATALALSPGAGAEDACRYRGDLDTPFCDDDGDLLADTPKDPARQQDPDPLFFTNSPLEAPAVFKELMRPFVEHLAQCTGRKVRFYDVYSSAAAIGPGLAKAALAGKVNGKLVDTSFVIDQDSDVAIVTERDPEGLELIRHSTAHLLAYAVKELFPDAQVTIGPVIEIYRLE